MSGIFGTKVKRAKSMRHLWGLPAKKSSKKKSLWGIGRKTMWGRK